MQRPPQLPSVLFARQAYQWINRVHQKFQALAALHLSLEKKQRLKQWLEVEFVDGALAFTGLSASRQQIIQAGSLNSAGTDRPSGSPDQSQNNTADPLAEKVLTDLFAALRRLEDLAQSAGPVAVLDLNLLWQLNQVTGNGEFRQTPAKASTIRAEHLPLILENACKWFAMDSFAELNPVEQAAIALLRLLEIAPFEQANQQTALLAASLFTLRNQLPPIIFKPEQGEAYTTALQEGLRMNTQPMVELVAAAIEQTLDGMMNFIAEDR
jgi:hypothetical protein